MFSLYCPSGCFAVCHDLFLIPPSFGKLTLSAYHCLSFADPPQRFAWFHSCQHTWPEEKEIPQHNPLFSFPPLAPIAIPAYSLHHAQLRLLNPAQRYCRHPLPLFLLLAVRLPAAFGTAFTKPTLIAPLSLTAVPALCVHIPFSHSFVRPSREHSQRPVQSCFLPGPFRRALYSISKSFWQYCVFS